MSDNWTVARTNFSRDALESANTIFCVSNGYLSLKGNLLEQRTGRYPTTLVAGLFDQANMFAFVRPVSYERRHFDPKYFDDAGLSPSIANLPDPLFTRLFVDGHELHFASGNVHDFEQTYELYSGVYRYAYTIEHDTGRRTRISMERFCEATHPHRARLRYRVEPLNYHAELRLDCGIDGAVRSNLQGDRQFDVVGAAGDERRVTMSARTILKQHTVEIGIANAFEAAQPLSSEPFVEHSRVLTAYRFEVVPDTLIELTRAITVATSEDSRHDVACDPLAELDAAAAEPFAVARDRHARWWAEKWETADVEIEGDDEAQLGLRFCLTHLIAAAPRHTDKLPTPCKLLTGEWYQGTVFYDTDLYIEPFYLFTEPRLARNLLNYRHICLGPGKQIAERFGWKGAKLAWQAGPYGEEELGYWWRYTLTNIHINGDVAYSLMQYWNATRDIEFMANQGIDMLVEFSRFYVSRATCNHTTGDYDFVNVAGPDEGHNESANNFYTNLLIRKTLTWAAEWLERLRQEIEPAYSAAVARLRIDPSEPASWLEVAAMTPLLYDPETKLYEQYDGFYALAPPPPNLVSDRKEWWTPVFPYKAIHQPDTVMALTLFRDEFPEEVRTANWTYYRPMTMNFSSMSYVINSIAAKEACDMEDAYRNFVITALEDLDESLTSRHDVFEGIHGTASGGAWLAAVFGFGGVCLTGEKLILNPRLPERWTRLAFKLLIRGARLSFDVTQSRLSVTVDREPALRLPVTIWGREMMFESGGEYSFDLRSAE